MKTYRDEMLRTLVGFEDRQTLLHAVLGIAGESGEIVDAFKKSHVRKTEINTAHLIEELGDLRWYMELACICLNTTLEEVEHLNIEKLRKRYPNGFTVIGVK